MRIAPRVRERREAINCPTTGRITPRVRENAMCRHVAKSTLDHPRVCRKTRLVQLQGYSEGSPACAGERRFVLSGITQKKRISCGLMGGSPHVCGKETCLSRITPCAKRSLTCIGRITPRVREDILPSSFRITPGAENMPRRWDHPACAKDRENSSNSLRKDHSNPKL